MAEEKKEDKKPEAEEKKEDKKPEGDAAAGGEGGEAPAEGAEAAAGGGKKKKIIIIAVIAVLLLGGIGAGVFFSGILGGGEKEMTEEEKLKLAQTNYYDMEEFLVNLNNPGKQVSFLKMKITLELPNLAAKAAVESKLPKITDSFQVYLRELRNSDLQGSSGIQRLKEELLLRINKILEPEKVDDILFKEIIVQ